MSEHYGTTTEEGNPVCVPGSCSCSSESKSNPVALLVPLIGETKDKKKPIVKVKPGEKHVDENS